MILLRIKKSRLGTVWVRFGYFGQNEGWSR